MGCCRKAEHQVVFCRDAFQSAHRSVRYFFACYTRAQVGSIAGGGQLFLHTGLAAADQAGRGYHRTFRYQVHRWAGALPGWRSAGQEGGTGTGLRIPAYGRTHDERI